MFKRILQKCKTVYGIDVLETKIAIATARIMQEKQSKLRPRPEIGFRRWQRQKVLEFEKRKLDKTSPQS
jgi:hypothetical protein